MDVFLLQAVGVALHSTESPVRKRFHHCADLLGRFDLVVAHHHLIYH